MTDETTTSPEVLPGDLITRPGLYKSRGGDIVRITGWDDGWWVSEWHGTVTWYGSDGRQRFRADPEKGQWDLERWVAPLPASEVEPETTTEQLAEIEGQATQYTPPDGWRLLPIGEMLREGDVSVRADGYQCRTERVGSIVGANQRYIRRIEQPEAQPQPVQVREGRWQTRGGDTRNVTPTPEGCDGRRELWPWWDAQYWQFWTRDGRYHPGGENPLDLDAYLGPIEPQPQPQPEPQAADYTPPEGWRLLEVGEEVDIPGRDQYVIGPNRYIRPIEPQQEPQPEPVQVREGRWKTRGGEVKGVKPTPPYKSFAIQYPWWDGRITWRNDGRYVVHEDAMDLENAMDLLEYLGPIEPEIGWQAETILRLQGEAHVLNMEIGGLERQLVQRDARIRDLETLHAAASQAVVDAGKENDALRLQVQNRQNKCEQQKGRIGFLETLNAGNDAAISDYRTKVEKLQGLVDTARGQLEAAATERDELRAAIDAADKQLDQKDAQIRDLQIELDAAQQVPADSPELRQLRLDLAEVTRERDQYKTAYDQIFADLVTIRETTTAETVEAIIEWLQPFRGCNSPSLALLLIESLPHIMRSLTGLADEEIE